MSQFVYSIHVALYDSWWCVKGLSLSALVAQSSNACVDGDVSGWDASFCSGVQEVLAALRSVTYQDAHLTGHKSPTERLLAASKFVVLEAVGIHPNGNSDNWAENSQAHDNKQAVSSLAPTASAPIHITVEGDDGRDIGCEASEESARFMEAALKQYGFLGTQSYCRVFINDGGPAGATSFCSARFCYLLDNTPASTPVQPRGVGGATCRPCDKMRSRTLYTASRRHSCGSGPMAGMWTGASGQADGRCRAGSLSGRIKRASSWIKLQLQKDKGKWLEDYTESVENCARLKQQKAFFSKVSLLTKERKPYFALHATKDTHGLQYGSVEELWQNHFADLLDGVNVDNVEAYRAMTSETGDCVATLRKRGDCQLILSQRRSWMRP
eukprot:6043876-Amphidinium_carterae.3